MHLFAFVSAFIKVSLEFRWLSRISQYLERNDLDCPPGLSFCHNVGLLVRQGCEVTDPAHLGRTEMFGVMTGCPSGRQKSADAVHLEVDIVLSVRRHDEELHAGILPYRAVVFKCLSPDMVFADFKQDCDGTVGKADMKRNGWCIRELLPVHAVDTVCRA